MSAYTRPLLIQPGGSEQLLERAPLTAAASGDSYGENWLQDLVYRYPAALPVAEIDSTFAGLVPLCRELPTPVGPVDVVYITRDGRPVVVEAKLWRNPEARRKVIGQLLDYAKELSAWGFEDLDTAVRRARRAEDGERPKGVIELLGLRPDSAEAARVHDALTRSLARFDVLLLVVGDGIREGVGEIAEFLEKHASLHFTFGLVEIAIFRMPGGGQLIQPRVLLQANVVNRFVVDVRSGHVEEDDPPEESAPGAEPESERAKALNAFWTRFTTALVLDDRRQEMAKPTRSGNVFFRMPGWPDAWVSAYVARAADEAGVYAGFRAGPNGDRLFDTLFERKDEIERELGLPVKWNRTKRWIITDARFRNPILEANPEEVRLKLSDWTNRYVNVFRPRFHSLARDQS